jgi:ubiquinone/menaquinone biosynthesis C-methylase UbiE
MWFLNYSNVIDPLLKDLRIRTIKFAGIKTGDRVLDVCCGTGDQALYYAKEGIIAYGIDLDPGMIKTAERNKKELGLNNVSFQIADAQNLPFEDIFFDCVSISFALHEKERRARDKIVSEMKRVVKKGGSLIFIDFKVPQPKNIYSYLIRAIEHFAGRNHYEYFKNYLEQGGLSEILKKNQIYAEKKNYTKNGIIEMIKAKK